MQPQSQRERFDEHYLRSQTPVMRAIERQVCGCAYGANSWTTRDEASRIGALLGLRPGMRLLDVGAGSGWPGLYLAQTSGCDVALVDLPFEGLRIAAGKVDEHTACGTCWVAVADGANLPFAEASFDAVSHSDILCCLADKRSVLAACRRVVRDRGRMVFSVITVAPGLSEPLYRRAVANGPEFIEAEADYETLLEATGWQVQERRDLTRDYTAACQRQIRADTDNRDALVRLIGESDFAARQADWQSKLEVLGEGLMRRELYVAVPANEVR